MALTSKQIEAAGFGSSPERLPDGLGLYLRLYRSGAKAFETRVTSDGKRHWLQLGHFPDVSLKNARSLAGLVQLQIENGRTVQQVREILKAGDIEELTEREAPPITTPTRRACEKRPMTPIVCANI